MKKSVTLKKFGLTAVTLFVCFAIMMTCFALSVPSNFAFADEGTLLFDGIKVQETCDYGDKFEVTKPESGTDVKVTAPNGTNVDLGTEVDGHYEITASQTGSYTVTYSKDGAEYDFRVYVMLDEEYFLRVDDNGADIPTYIKKGNKFKLPDAGVYYYDENKVLREFTDAEIVINSGDTQKKYTAGEEVTCDANGKMFFVYTAQLGENGSKYISQKFTVNVQDNFEDVSRPTLTVAGVSSNISVKRSVTLPKATASDDFDENIKIKITVTGPDGAVRLADVDDNGYGYQKPVDETYTQEDFDRDYPAVKFDNDEAMTFYPMKEGTYTVEYVAIDDAGKESAKRTFTMNAGDRVAPVFKNIADDKIPEKWGMTVKKTADGEAIAESGKITFTVPEIVDNKSVVWNEDYEGDDLIDLLFRVTDADNNKTIIEFTDILASREKNEQGEYVNASKFSKKGNSVYADGEDLEFDLENGFTFDFSKYARKDSDGNTMTSKAGKYTVYFRAGDKAGNHSSKSYTVTLEDEFVDDKAPAIEKLEVPSYISTTESFTVPAPVATDANDTRLTIEYAIYNKAGESLTVKGGEKAEFKTADGKTYLVVDDDEDPTKGLEIAESDELYFLVSATDDAGNTTYNTSDNSSVATKSESVVSIIGGTEKTLGATINISGLTGHKTGDVIYAGEITINAKEAMRKYTGFEIGVYDANGKAVNVEFTTYTTTDKTDAVINVKDIKILPTTVGEHTMVIRVFNVNGYSRVNVLKFDVAASDAGQGGTGSAATIGTSGSVNVKYKLHNETISNIGDKNKEYCVVRKFNTTSVVALMGSEATFKTQGSARIQDGYAEVTAGAVGEFTPYGANDGKYTVSITDTAKPVIEVQGVMPTYTEKKGTKKPDGTNEYDGKVMLPSVVAYTENGAATVTVTVKHNNSIVATTAEDGNKYSFVATNDGTYTVEYVAVAANGEKETYTATITAGDVKGPEFKLLGEGTIANAKKVRVNDSFAFDKVQIQGDENLSDIRVTKTLIDPTGNTVSSATVTGSYNSYANVQYANEDDKDAVKLTMSGDYIVEYKLEDKAGNTTIQRVKLTVASKGSGKPKTFTGLSIALTVIAVVLLAGVIIYVVRFRKVKSK